MRVIENKTHAKIKDTEHGPCKAKLEFIIIIMITIIVVVVVMQRCNYLYAIQLKGREGATAWPVLWLVKLELKNSVKLKSRVKICI